MSAEYLAAQAYLAKREGLNKGQIRERLKQAADALLHDEVLREQVLERSLAKTATDLEAIITTTKIESEALGITDLKNIREILGENLQDCLARKRGPERD